ncbi:MAG: hypothetical protein COV66_09045 [Nitrospinae bacterium CG11_big_fil_rev_8_21_14_0_20_45_15]|nr:MAG: hypothetical protein COV66_09045 [Nitrospinae bacterium CG11_big_fil_rev_8_21_14_0_20_45_15]
MIKIHGYCHKCKAPVFLESTMDALGNTVSILHCWNGHYHWINIDNLSEDLPPETRKHIVEQISFFTV